MIIESIIESIYRLLPDKCEDPDCKGDGIRGNENVYNGKLYCDYCSMKFIQEKKDDHA